MDPAANTAWTPIKPNIEKQGKSKNESASPLNRG